MGRALLMRSIPAVTLRNSIDQEVELPGREHLAGSVRMPLAGGRRFLRAMRSRGGVGEEPGAQYAEHEEGDAGQRENIHHGVHLASWQQPRQRAGVNRLGVLRCHGCGGTERWQALDDQVVDHRAEAKTGYHHSASQAYHLVTTATDVT